MNQASEPITFLATAPRGTERLLKEELRTLGAGAIRPGQSDGRRINHPSAAWRFMLDAINSCS